jgi:hypothetical protein
MVFEPMSDIDQTLWFLVLIVCLGGCFVWALWEIEAARQRWRERRQFVRDAVRSILMRPERR